ncbi:hypothetical protein OU798_16410 [Prolixibacteraceae bacterium Z1-6]|uniref:Outer membrane protein beta-barrel domain-containing protein n=1 Tax=Draconibacterium aestuarii TaxID=2998507 RepID=A0A9X3F7H2_9BACT|nr:hypothetical protein [Prolixibacteraceae bacterium Z1-6]
MKKYIIIAVLALITFRVDAQDGSTIFVNYLPSLPLGGTADFTDEISPRGVDFEVQHFLNEDLSVGFNIGWTLFRQKISGETFYYKDLTITGTQFRYTNIVPLTLNVKKYFMANGDYVPYVGVGIGTSYAEQRNEIGVFELEDDKWQFHMAPEIGMLYDLNYKSYLSVKLKYNYSVKAGSFPSMSYLSLGLGIGLK